MSPFIRSFLVLLLFPVAALAATIRGVVKDSTGQPVAGASVSIDGARSAVTAADGAFAVESADGKHTLRVSRAGFQTEMRSVAGGDSIEIELRPALAETIVVSGIRADEVTPVTKTNLERDQIEQRYRGQDIPLLLRDAPSINAYTESGIGGSGYSYITLRGVSPTRINFTLDAVPLADSEDMGTYFADFPDLAESLQSVQIQRGVGTSTVGSPSFGGSINLQSIDLTQQSTTQGRLSAGAFGGRLASVGYQSGALPGGFALYSRFSYNRSDGFREHSGVRQRNLFVSAAKQNESSQLKLTGFSGHEKQQMSFYATDRDTLKQNMKFNPLSPEDKDSFGYDLAQLQYLRAISGGVNFTASAYYQRGYGWYRLFDYEPTKTNLRQYGLDGMLIGSMLTMSYTRGPFSANYGLNVNRFRREHTRDLVGGPRDYYNYGTKGEANAFAKFGYEVGKWHLYSDAQLRYTDFRYHGDVHIKPIDWTFFNPKLGARYELSPSSSVYTSVGMSTREPTRNDLFQGEDNATVSHDLHAVRPERLVDFEAGWDHRVSDLSLAANLYAMESRNEIAATGELSEIGLALRRNVDRSHRRGIELDAGWQALPSLRLRTIANVSRNRIRSWTQFYDVKDPGGNYLTSKPRVHRSVNPILTPDVIVSQAIDFAPTSMLTVGAVGRYVGKSYLDNTNNAAFTTPSFFVLEASAAVDLSRWLPAGRPRLTIQVNNALDNKRVYPSGYSYLYITREKSGAESISGIPYFYPQATRNAVVMLDVRM